jgi:hypothetical protein
MAGHFANRLLSGRANRGEGTRDQVVAESALVPKTPLQQCKGTSRDLQAHHINLCFLLECSQYSRTSIYQGTLASSYIASPKNDMHDGHVRTCTNTLEHWVGVEVIISPASLDNSNTVVNHVNRTQYDVNVCVHTYHPFLIE